MTIQLVVLLAGGLLGAGGVVALAGLVPTKPDLVDGVSRLLPSAEARSVRVPVAQSRREAIERRVLRPAARAFGLSRLATDLHMLDVSPEALALKKIGYAAVGLFFPPLLAGLMAVAGVPLPAGLPLAGGLLLAAVFFVLPDLTLRQQAAIARTSMRAATCVYLELVAMERLADAGPTEALDRAASVGGSPEFARIRDATLRAELAGRPSWEGLSDLATTTGVAELGDAADIMRMAGRDGAAVYATLRARASSLRTQMLAESTAKANAASEHMVVPVSLLGLCFMALLGYPAFVRILLA